MTDYEATRGHCLVQINYLELEVAGLNFTNGNLHKEQLTNGNLHEE